MFSPTVNTATTIATATGILAGSPEPLPAIPASPIPPDVTVSEALPPVVSPAPTVVPQVRETLLLSTPSRQATLLPTPPTAAPLHRFSLIMGPTSPGTGANINDLESALDTDEEDEFFDAIESNTLPNLVVNESLSLSRRPSLILQDESVVSRIIDREQYVGYMDLRDRLEISSDDRPPMSLWSVLKNSIGKDLTKISFPVFFNEPTSMLQRMVG